MIHGVSLDEVLDYGFSPAVKAAMRAEMMYAPMWGNSGDSEGVGFVTGSTAGTNLTANVTPGNDGAWTQLIATTARQYHGIYVTLQSGNNAVAGNGIVELGVGASSAEQTLFTIPTHNNGANQRGNGLGFWLPLAIPGGIRMAARVRRSATASYACRIMVIGFQGPSRYLPPFHRITDYGVDLANARGTSVDPGGTANTQGSYTQIVASTTNPIKLLYVVSTRRDSAGIASNIMGSIQVFIGPSTGTVLTPEYPNWQANSTTDVDVPLGGVVGPFAVNLPAATELGAKCRNTGITAGERETQVILWGLD